MSAPRAATPPEKTFRASASQSIAEQNERRFHRARHGWDNRFGNLVLARRNWQLLAVSLLALVFFETAALVLLGRQSKVVPYVVEVDKFGTVANFGPAEQLKRVDERLIRSLLSHWIWNTRSVVSDPSAQRVLIARSYAYLTQSAEGVVNQHLRENNPYANDLHVQVQIESVLRLGEDSWQVEWVETRGAGVGASNARKSQWRAAVRTELRKIESADTLAENPLGLYITDVNWTRLKDL